MSSPIKKALRFEVLKRDAFSCQYCGAKAPDVLLHVDHVHPESKGGEATMLNLVTACASCNLGKSDRVLSDDAAVTKQQAQMQLLAERREQVQMLVEWRAELAEIEDDLAAALGESFSKLTGLQPLPADIDVFRRLVKSSTTVEAFDTLDAAAAQYVKTRPATNDAATRLMRALPRIAATRKTGDHELLGRAAYAFGIVRNRLSADRPWRAKSAIEAALRRGVAAGTVNSICREEDTVWRVIESLEAAQ